MTDHLRRRTVLASLASAATGAGLVAAVGTESASAAVTLEQFTAEDHEAALRSEPSDVRVTCEIGYRWDVPDSQPTPSIFEVRLLAGDGETEIGKADGRASQRTQSDVQTVEASVLDAGGLSASDFAPAEQARTVDVPLRLELEVIGDNQTLATAAQSTTGEITVTQAGYDSALHGSVGGEAEFTVEE